MEIIRDMHNSEAREYFVVPYWSKQDVLDYDKYTSYEEIESFKDKTIKVREYNSFGRSGIPTSGVYVVEKHFELEFLGDWKPKFLDRYFDYIERDKLFILPKIEVIITSIDDWNHFTREQWNDVQYWYKPRTSVIIKGEYIYYEPDKDGIGCPVKRLLDLCYNFESLNPIEVIIYSTLFLDKFESDWFETQYFIEFIKGISKHPEVNIISFIELSSISRTLSEIYEEYPFIDLRFRDNLKNTISRKMDLLKHRINMLERDFKDLDRIPD